MNMRRRTQFLLIVAAATAVIGGTFGVALASSSGDSPNASDGSGPTTAPAAGTATSGPALAEQLGLRRLQRNPDGEIDTAGCQTGMIEFEDGPIYCFDGQIDPNSPTLHLDQAALFTRLAGDAPLTDDAKQTVQRVDEAAASEG